MGKALDLLGKRFGRLVVVERTKDRNNKVSWHCMCDCGNDSYVGTYRLVHNVTTSCGCLREEKWRESQDKISAKAKDKIAYVLNIPCIDIDASMNPRNREPASPMNIFAGLKLNGRKPIAAPARAIIKTAVPIFPLI